MQRVLKHLIDEDYHQQRTTSNQENENARNENELIPPPTLNTNINTNITNRKSTIYHCFNDLTSNPLMSMKLLTENNELDSDIEVFPMHSIPYNCFLIIFDYMDNQTKSSFENLSTYSRNLLLWRYNSGPNTNYRIDPIKLANSIKPSIKEGSDDDDISEIIEEETKGIEDELNITSNTEDNVASFSDNLVSIFMTSAIGMDILALIAVQTVLVTILLLIGLIILIILMFYRSFLLDLCENHLFNSHRRPYMNIDEQDFDINNSVFNLV